MFVAESRSSRRVVAVLDGGAEVVAGIGELCRARGVRSGEVRGYGVVEAAELRELDASTGAWGATRRVAGPATLVQLVGTIADREGKVDVAASCSLVEGTGEGQRVVGGSLLHARAYSVELVIESFDDVVVRRSLDAGTGLERWSDAEAITQPLGKPDSARSQSGARPSLPASRSATPSGTSFGNAVIRPVEPTAAREPATSPSPAAAPPAAAPPAPPAAGSPSWSDVVAAAEENEPDPAGPVEEHLRAGDIIEHTKFGRCDVERIEGDYEFAQVRLRNGRLVRLSLDVIQLVRDGMDGDRRRYRNILPR